MRLSWTLKNEQDFSAEMSYIETKQREQCWERVEKLSTFENEKQKDVAVAQEYTLKTQRS